MVGVLLIAGFVIVTGLVFVLKPVEVWQKTEARWYKYPEAHEPSRAGYAARQFTGVFMIASGILLLITMAVLS